MPDHNMTLLEALGDEVDAYADEIPLQVLNKKLRKMNVGELHFLIQRNLVLEIAAPIAVERLTEDPLLKAASYPGDLMVVLMEANSAYWKEHYELWAELIAILGEAVNTIRERAEKDELGDYMPFYLGDDFMGALLHFRELFKE